MAVDVVTVAESLNHILVICNVGKHPKLNLRVVRINQNPTGTRYKEATHFPSKVCPDRNILKVRFR